MYYGRKKLYCAVGKEMPWEKMKMNLGMTVLSDIKRSAPPGHSVSFYVLLPGALWAPAV